MTSKRIKPELPGGFHDYAPNQAAIRAGMLSKMREVFERFGFVPLETSAVEREEIITRGDDDFGKQLFFIGRGDDKETGLVLRPELTASLARFVSANATDLTFPFKRYQFGRVWRGERQQAGRYHEFMQCDIDIVGSKRMEADAEIIALIYNILSTLGIEKIMIKVGHRKVLEGLSEYAGYDSEKTQDVLRIVDKNEKIGWKEISEELSSSDATSLEKDQIEAIKTFLEEGSGDDVEKVLDRVSSLMGDSAIAQEGIKELREISKSLSALNVPSDAWTVDFSVVRGLGYYTGSVFEAILPNLPEMGSVFAGGRYDELVGQFSSSSLTALGASVGFDRLFEAMIQLGLIEDSPKCADVAVLNFDESCVEDVQRLATELREKNVSAELYVGSESSLSGQLSWAVKKGITYAVLIGGKEKEDNTVQIKNLSQNTQEQVPLGDVVQYIISNL